MLDEAGCLRAKLYQKSRLEHASFDLACRGDRNLLLFWISFFADAAPLGAADGACGVEVTDFFLFPLQIEPAVGCGAGWIVNCRET